MARKKPKRSAAPKESIIYVSGWENPEFSTIRRVVFAPTPAIRKSHPTASGCINYLGKLHPVNREGRRYYMNADDHPVDGPPLSRRSQ